ncbi:tRNA (uracil-5-)-methyltransferase [Nematocida homosporus]|uniref:tRNA (uracil-5-)-methyltransferase n=1 Tax=Nematocida homosporus TaxID=1912981 RepID=UPI00221E970E|nr:tRNA (uracil-5-)-methyltransferase [Nematocida homosporus]KAI5185140.1 tRNA (uracil-5-)-methyltransferase [Nematocida homosporus]
MTVCWRINSIPNRTRRATLLEAINKTVDGPFSLAFKDNRRTAIIITESEIQPEIHLNGRKLSLKRLEESAKSAVDSVTPLWNLSYEDQLATKAAAVQKALAVIAGATSATVQTHASPIRQGYRNRCEFTFGFDTEDRPILGFRTSGYSTGPNRVTDPSDCIYNVSTEMLDKVKEVNNYLAQHPDLVYNRISATGLLRLLLLRRIGTQLVGVLLAAGSSLSETATNPHLVQFSQSLQIDSLYLAVSTGIHEGLPPNTPLHLLHGSNPPHQQTLGGCQFTLAPLSFFQVNIPVAEILVQIVKDASANQTILDVCCGSGVLGICAAQGTTAQVIGLELDAQAITSAQLNAATNQTQATYYTGRVEDTLTTALTKVSGPCTALLDPPRAGFPNRLLLSLLSTPNITRILYISCSYRLVIENLKTISKSHFILKQIHILDMFPYTDQAECVFLFEKNPNSTAVPNQHHPPSP